MEHYKTKTNFLFIKLCFCISDNGNPFMNYISINHQIFIKIITSFLFAATKSFFFFFSNEKLQSPRFDIINVTTSDSEHTFFLRLIAMYILCMVAIRSQNEWSHPQMRMTVNVTTTHFIHHYKLCSNHT